MQVITALLTELIDALDERHYVSAQMIAAATYVVALRKSTNGTMINELYEIDHLCQYGNFHDASVLASQIRAELEQLI